MKSMLNIRITMIGIRGVRVYNIKRIIIIIIIYICKSKLDFK